MGIIVCGGKEIEVEGLSVKTWRYSPKLAFGRLKDRKETRAVCLHWTGGTGNHEQVFRTLTAARTSVHFVINADGSVFQHCDSDKLAMHCKGVNHFSVGIEIVNPATEISREKPPRALTREVIHDVDQVRTVFWPEQFRAALLLAEALCAHYGLPLQVPTVGNDVRSTEMTAEELATVRGVVGHLHAHPSKCDPGLALLRAVQALPHHGTLRPDGPAQ